MGQLSLNTILLFKIILCLLIVIFGMAMLQSTQAKAIFQL